MHTPDYMTQETFSGKPIGMCITDAHSYDKHYQRDRNKSFLTIVLETEVDERILNISGESSIMSCLGALVDATIRDEKSGSLSGTYPISCTGIEGEQGKKGTYRITKISLRGYTTIWDESYNQRMYREDKARPSIVEPKMRF